MFVPNLKKFLPVIPEILSDNPSVVIGGHWWSLVFRFGHWWSLVAVGVFGGHWWSLVAVGFSGSTLSQALTGAAAIKSHSA